MYNVNNNCSTGSSALFMGKQLIEVHKFILDFNTIC